MKGRRCKRRSRCPFNVDPEPPFPDPPTRDAILNGHLSFQGLIVQTVQFGTLPWFEAALAWLTPADRINVYASKIAAGDTHGLIFIPSGPPLYDEPNQPYSADRFGALDWTHGGTAIDDRLTGLIREVVRAGFPQILLFLGGDGTGHQPIAMRQLDLLYANDDYRTTLHKYCVVLPGFDGVFYGWTPDEIIAFGLKFRALFPHGHLGLEHDMGHIPVGEGGDDYRPRSPGQNPYVNPGRMQDFDVVFGEFGGQPSAVHSDNSWQILGRMLGPAYRRPPDQPSGDDPTPPHYLPATCPRGPIAYWVLEFGEYEFVRGGCSPESVAAVEANRAYFRAMGAGNLC